MSVCVRVANNDASICSCIDGMRVSHLVYAAVTIEVSIDFI